MEVYSRVVRIQACTLACIASRGVQPSACAACAWALQLVRVNCSGEGRGSCPLCIYLSGNYNWEEAAARKAAAAPVSCDCTCTIGALRGAWQSGETR